MLYGMLKFFSAFLMYAYKFNFNFQVLRDLRLVGNSLFYQKYIYIFKYRLRECKIEFLNPVCVVAENLSSEKSTIITEFLH